MARLSQQERKDLTRQRLRVAALSEFSKCGLVASSIDRITLAAGYSRGAFYANYRSKSEIALELLTDHLKHLIEEWDQMIERAVDPGYLLRRLEEHFDHMSGEEEWWQLRVELRLDAARSPEFCEVYEAANRDMLVQLRPMLVNLCRYADCLETTNIDYIALVLHAFAYGLQFERGRLASLNQTPGQVLIKLILDLLGRPAKLMQFYSH